MQGTRFGTVNTQSGQAVNFRVPYELGANREEASADFERTRATIAALDNISLPTTSTVHVEHGGYGRYNRFDLEQLEYQGARQAYYEVLHVRDAPDGRHPFVSNGHHGYGEWFSNFFAEWESTADAIAHARSTGGFVVSLEMLNGKTSDEKIPGLIRAVDTGYLSPWFYATGDAELMGDFVFPEHLAQDPIFTVGKQFLVPEKSATSKEPIMVLKTCMGCVVRTGPARRDAYGRSRGDEAEGTNSYRAVQWHDGSVTPVYPTTPYNEIPIPLADQDTWVVEAQRSFNLLLAGGNKGFEVQFADGGKFVGKYVPPAEAPKPDPAGSYLLAVTMADGSVREGWVHDFTPTPESPTVISFVMAKMKGEVVQIETREKKIDAKGKKWPGVYHARPSADTEGAL